MKKKIVCAPVVTKERTGTMTLGASSTQVTTRLQSAGGGGGDALHSFQQQQGSGGSAAAEGGFLTAALGTKWAHCVNVRLVLERAVERRLLKVRGERRLLKVGRGGGRWVVVACQPG